MLKSWCNSLKNFQRVAIGECGGEGLCFLGIGAPRLGEDDDVVLSDSILRRFEPGVSTAE